MAKRKREQYRIWVEGGSPIPPEIQELLPKPILELALREDVTGPFSGGLGDEYVARLAVRLHEPLLQKIRRAGSRVTATELAEICWRAAGETFAIRRLKLACQLGEISREQLRELPFYPEYRDYFEHTPEIVARASQLAAETAAADLPSEEP